LARFAILMQERVRLKRARRPKVILKAREMKDRGLPSGRQKQRSHHMPWNCDG